MFNPFRRKKKDGTKEAIKIIEDKFPFKDLLKEHIHVISAAMIGLSEALSELNKKDRKKAVALSYWVITSTLISAFGQDKILDLYSAYTSNTLENMGVPITNMVKGAQQRMQQQAGEKKKEEDTAYR